MSKRPRSDSDSEHSEKLPRPTAKRSLVFVERVEKNSMEILGQLLDMTHVPPSSEPSHFLTLATTLMHSFHFCIADTSIPPNISAYELLDVEFYWYSEETGHTDPFTYVDEQGQGQAPGNWYFCSPQQVPRLGKSDPPSSSSNTDGDWDWAREGLYLTLGVSSPSHSCDNTAGAPLSEDKPVQQAYGGILLRALRDVVTGETTKEPFFIMAKLLHALGSQRVSNLVNELWGGDTCALKEESPGRVFLRPISAASLLTSSPGLKLENSLMNKPTIYTCPRVNLDLSSIPNPSDVTFSHPRVQYLIRPYRFIQHPHLLGSPSARITYGLITSGLSCPEIAALLDISLSDVETMERYLEEGRKKGRSGLKGLVGREGRQAAVTIPGYMNLAGIVESILKEGDIRGQSQGGEGNDPTVVEVVLSEMSASQMFDRLLEHGCIDISADMDFTELSSAAVAGGGFGDVWKGKLASGEKVAIKCLRFSTIIEDQPKGLKRLMRETYMWSKAKHDNVQQLLGITMLQGRLGMVSLWREHGNMQEYIRRNPSVNRYHLCAQVASGVSYLHGINMVHGDIKAMNILVSADGIAKISDFDHSILSNCTLAFSATTNAGGGTLRWMAPELLLRTDSESNHGVLKTTQTDVYALGMTMLEILTGKVPYTKYAQDFAIFNALVKKQPPDRPEVLNDQTAQAETMWRLLLQCWDHTPAARPSAPWVLTQVLNVELASSTGRKSSA
ncbi:kinase-like protein [Ceratobasidium sp. AG-I]|nr:kinase-like protein [Ceratobasidium sp. AG-I]